MAGENENTLDSAMDGVFGSTLAADPTSSTYDDMTTQEPDTTAEPDTSAQQQNNNEQQDDDPEGLGPVPKGPPQRDANGNIIDHKGRVLEGRQDKRDFYAYNRVRLAADKLSKRNDELQRENQQLQHIAALPKALGLDMQAVQEAIQFRADFQREPVGTIREIVARALNNGYTMEQLFGGEATGIINSKMMQQTIDQRLQPLTSRFAREETEQRIHTQAQSDMDNFIAEHQYADVHGEQIAKLVGDHEISPQKAYYELRGWAQQHGFDFTQPLEPQVQQRVQQLQQQQRDGSQQQQPAQRQPSTPGTRRVANGAMPTAPVSAMAPADSSFRDIVADAFRDLANQR